MVTVFVIGLTLGLTPRRDHFFTRGSSRDEYAKYTESSEEYVINMKTVAGEMGNGQRVCSQASDTPCL